MDLARPALDFQGHRFSLILIRKIIIEFFFSFLVAFLFFFTVFLVNQLIVIYRDIIKPGVEPINGLLLLFYSMPMVVALASPFGSLVGSLLVVARMSASNELIALQSLGISLRSVLYPILSISFLISILAFSMNNIFLPLGNNEFIELRGKLLRSNTEIIFEPFSSRKINDTTLVTQEVSQGRFTKPMIFTYSETGRPQIISAEYAIIDQILKDEGTLKLDMVGVTLVELGNEQKDVSVSKAEKMSRILSLDSSTSTVNFKSPTEMGYLEILTKISDLSLEHDKRTKELDYRGLVAENRFSKAYLDYLLQNGQQELQVLSSLAESQINSDEEKEISRDLQIYWIEFSKKIAIPFGCFSLVILGFPLGTLIRKSSRGVGLIIGLILAFLYWMGLLVGQYIANSNPNLNASLIIWFPNLLFLTSGLISLFFMSRR